MSNLVHVHTGKYDLVYNKALSFCRAKNLSNGHVVFIDDESGAFLKNLDNENGTLNAMLDNIFND